jgi:hypothetical protein
MHTAILPAAGCETRVDIVMHLRNSGWREIGNAGEKRWYCSYCVRLKNEVKKKSKETKKVSQEDIPF